jgi:hypothetical protein
LGQAETIYAQHDDRLGLAAVANVRGSVLLDDGRPEQALHQYETGLRYAQAIGNPLEQALAHEGLGRSALALGQPGGAAQLRIAPEVLQRIGAAEAGRVESRLEQLEG